MVVGTRAHTVVVIEAGRLSSAGSRSPCVGMRIAMSASVLASGQMYSVELPPWTVLLVAGASGVGKSSVSYRLAAWFGAAITPVDDIQVAVKRVTTPEQMPKLHFFDNHREEYFAMDDVGKLEHIVSVSTELLPALEAVVANRLEEGRRVVLEGDFILPELATRQCFGEFANGGRVRGLVIYEDAEAQIVANYRAREGTQQLVRARASHTYSNWLRAEAERLGIPAVAARPWETVLERCIAAVS